MMGPWPEPQDVEAFNAQVEAKAEAGPNRAERRKGKRGALTIKGGGGPMMIINRPGKPMLVLGARVTKARKK